MRENDLIRFLKLYFSHPYFNQLERPYIRLAFAASNKLKKRLQNGAKNLWYMGSRVYYQDELLSVNNTIDNNEILAEINEFNSKGCDCYYYPNIGPEDGQSAISDKDIQQVLYAGIDYDYTLPVSLDDIIKELGLIPTVLYQTSKPLDVIKYQMLYALNIEDKKEAKATCKELISALGSDKKTVNPATLLRLPGTRNWKGSDKGINAGYSKVIKGTDALAGITYRPKVISKQLKKFSRSDTSQQLIQAAQYQTVVRDNQATAKTLKNRSKHPKTQAMTATAMTATGDYPEWQKALRRSRLQGLVTIKKGNRHNALISWSGALASEMSMGYMTLDSAHNVLCELAHSACECSEVEDEIETRELKNICDWLSECWDNDEKERESFFDDILGGVSNRTKFSSETKLVVSNPETKEGSNEGSSNVTPTNNQFYSWIDIYCSPTAAEQKQLDIVLEYKDKLQIAEENKNTVEIAKYNNLYRDHCIDSEWLQFLKEYFLDYQTVIDADGMCNELALVLLRRTEKLRLLHGPLFALPENIQLLQGSTATVNKVLNKAQVTLYFDSVMQELCCVIGDWQPELKQMPEVQGDLARLLTSAEDEAEIINSEGKVSTNQKKMKRLFKSKVDEYFAIKLNQRIKNPVLKAIVSHCLIWADQNDDGDSGKLINSELVFQNGVFSFGSGGDGVGNGGFRECHGHEQVLFPLHAHFNAKFAAEIRNVLGDGGDSGSSGSSGSDRNLGDLCSVMEENCPRYCRFLSEAFPNDYATWPLLLLMTGYCCLRDNPLQVSFMFSGISGSGKGTMSEIIEFIVGSGYGATVGSYKDLSRESESLNRFIGKSLVTCDECESASAKVHQDVFTTLKNITGGRKMRIRGIYREAFEAFLRAKFLLISNDPFPFADTAGAGARRFIPLSFDSVPEVVVEGLSKQIIASEGNLIATAAAVLLSANAGAGRKMFDVDDSEALSVGRDVLEANTAPVRQFLRKRLLTLRCIDGSPESNTGILHILLMTLVRYFAESEGIQDSTREDLSGYSTRKLEMFITKELKLLKSIQYVSSNKGAGRKNIGNKKYSHIKGYAFLLDNELSKDDVWSYLETELPADVFRWVKNKKNKQFIVKNN